jgi:hypothetical protein
MDMIYSLKIIQVDSGRKNIQQAQTIPGSTRPGVAKKVRAKSPYALRAR